MDTAVPHKFPFFCCLHNTGGYGNQTAHQITLCLKSRAASLKTQLYTYCYGHSALAQMLRHACTHNKRGQVVSPQLSSVKKHIN